MTKSFSFAGCAHWFNKKRNIKNSDNYTKVITRPKQLGH